MDGKWFGACVFLYFEFDLSILIGVGWNPSAF
jgi:hypothetical protein